jgi:uncharacterized membrane protein YhaH (DUF805 family)
MAGRKEQKKKISVNEAMRRMRPIFLMMMLIPFMGMIAAMIIIYMIQPKNMLLIEALIFFSMAIFIVTTYLFVKRMGNFTQGNPEPTPS